jgi:pentatricopeptide repeat protein
MLICYSQPEKQNILGQKASLKTFLLTNPCLLLLLLQDMLQRGCERNVITYSSLIAACEKGGRWELALELFAKMHEEGCKPNTVTYNSLIAACAHGENPSWSCQQRQPIRVHNSDGVYGTHAATATSAC